jgi:hypothetical protein
MFEGDCPLVRMRGHLVQYVIPIVGRNLRPRTQLSVELGAVGIVTEQDVRNIKVFFRPGVTLWFHIGELKRLRYSQ